MNARAELPKPGDLVAGKYRLVRSVGEGGMGVVFEAIHERLDQRVAVKMLLPQVIDAPDVLKRFEREARAAGRLRSRNAARVIDVDTTDGALPFMVMEYLEGHDLAIELEQRGPLPIGEAVGYLLQACNAMREAHSSGIVHRDLKPSNLFLAKDGRERVVKVLDFGISKLTFEVDSKLTATTTTIGTPAYMSPEQVRSARDVDERTDVWSLGVILYECLTGRLPFDGSPTAVAAAIVADTPERLSSIRSEVPDELEAVVAKTLAKRPADRFPDVRALALALAPFAPSGTAVLADSPDRLLVRPPTPLPFLDEARTVNMSDSAPHATVPGWTAHTERKGSRAFVFLGGAAALVAGGVLLVASLTKQPGRAGSMSASASASTSTPAATTSALIPGVSSGTSSPVEALSAAATSPAPSVSVRPMAHSPRTPTQSTSARPPSSAPVAPPPPKPKDPDHI